MDDMHFIMFPGISDKNRSYKPLWLTSASYEFPNCAMLNPSLSDRITLILYYAHVMDQKKILGDFYKLCKYNFENKFQSSSLESSINAWIKNSIVKLHRRRELIVSETLSTLQTQFICATSQVVFDVFCDYLVDSGKNGHNFSVNARPKRSWNTNWEILFPKSEMLLNATCLDSSPFLCRKENNKMSISMSNPLHGLRNFCLKFCYHPDPTQYIKFIQHFQEEPEKTHSSIINSQNCGTDNINVTQHSTKDPETEINSIIILPNSHITDNIIQYSRDYPEITITNSTQPSSDDPEAINSIQQSSGEPVATNSMQSSSGIPEKTNSTKYSSDEPEATNSTSSSIILQSNHIMPNTNSAQNFDNDQSSLSSESNSDSSGSWSCNDFIDDSISDDGHLRSYTSNNMFLEKCNTTIKWLQSTACNFDSDTVNFGEALTEENCLGSPSSRGSLNFVDIDLSDEEDEYEFIFFDGSPDTGFENDAFMDMSQGFENPCFEDSFSVFPVPSFLEMVNECWNDDMLELQDKPRKPTKVSFAPEPSLVTVQYFEKTEENTFDASLVLDNLRFRQRIAELGHMLSPFFTIEHRVIVQKRNFFHEN